MGGAPTSRALNRSREVLDVLVKLRALSPAWHNLREGGPSPSARLGMTTVALARCVSRAYDV